jgi:hypothetical protein
VSFKTLRSRFLDVSTCHALNVPASLLIFERSLVSLFSLLSVLFRWQAQIAAVQALELCEQTRQGVELRGSGDA